MHLRDDISPKVSVIIPLYNGEMYIEACVESVLSQTYQNYEIIIIDDGSTDNSYYKAENLKNLYPDKIKLLQHPNKENRGIARTRNLGIKMSCGHLISIIDQDDVWEKEKLSKQITYLLKYPKAKFIYSQAGFCDSSGKSTILDGYDAFGMGKEYKPYNVFSKLLYENFIPSITVMFYRECLNEIGYFEEGPRHEYEDWILWTKLAYVYQFIFIPEILAHYRIHSKSYSLHRTESCLDSHAEEHYIKCVFKFLFEKSSEDNTKLKSLLTRRILRFLARAKSWGADNKQITIMSNSLSEAFPFVKTRIRVMVFVAGLFSPTFAKLIRRLRRRIVGI